MSTPRPRSAPAHSPTIAPTTARVTPTRIPPRMLGRAAGISSVVRTWRRVARSDAAELEQLRVDRADADHRRDGDREEHDERADEDLAQQPRPEPQGDERGQGQDRRRLGGDEVGRQDALDEPAARQPVADDQGAARPDREAEGDLDERRARWGWMVPSRDRLDEARPDRRAAAAG